MASINPLRPISQRLNTTTVEELPHHASFLAASILDCAESIRTFETHSGDGAVALHKLKTKVTSLVQDRTQEGRFTGIVLVKALIDAGGAETIATSAPWARSLLSCLNKSDPAEVKRLAITTLTRLFLLTKDHQAQVREITTPILPTFMTTCVGLIKPLGNVQKPVERQIYNPLLATVLQCWLHLVQSFPATVRPTQPAIRNLIIGLISDDATPDNIRRLATRVLVALIHCAPKGSSDVEWSQMCERAIEAAHQNADVVFRSVVEEWTGIRPRSTTKVGAKISNVAKMKEDDAMGMGRWKGMQAGSVRITSLLQLIDLLVTETQMKGVSVPITPILDLLARVSAVTPPTAQYSMSVKQEIGRDERDELWCHLPRLHTAALKLLSSLVTTFQQALLPVSQTLLSQLWDIFEASSSNSMVRQTAYKAIECMLATGAVRAKAADATYLAKITHACCADLKACLSHAKPSSVPNGSDQSAKSSTLTWTPQQPHSGVHQKIEDVSPIVQAAKALLPILIQHVSGLMTANVRADVDSTAILIGHSNAMLASILHPPVQSRKQQRNTPSILPFWSRAYAHELSHESLVRPRMPVIRSLGRLGPELYDDKPVEDLSEGEDKDIVMDGEAEGITTTADMQVPQLADAAWQPLESTKLTMSLSETPVSLQTSQRKRDFADLESEAHVTSRETPREAGVLKKPRNEVAIADSAKGAKPPNTSNHDIQQSDHEMPDLAPSVAGGAGEASTKLTHSFSETPMSSATIIHQSQSVALTIPKVQAARTDMTKGGSLNDNDDDDDDSDDDDVIPTIDPTMTDEEEDEDENVEEEEEEDDDDDDNDGIEIDGEND